MNIICIFLFTLFCGSIGRRSVNPFGVIAGESRPFQDASARNQPIPPKRVQAKSRTDINVIPELSSDFLCQGDDIFYIECNECLCSFGIVECTRKFCPEDFELEGPACTGNTQWFQVGAPNQPECQWCNCIDSAPSCKGIKCPDFLNFGEEEEEGPVEEKPLEEKPKSQTSGSLIQPQPATGQRTEPEIHIQDKTRHPIYFDTKQPCDQKQEKRGDCTPTKSTQGDDLQTPNLSSEKQSLSHSKVNQAGLNQNQHDLGSFGHQHVSGSHSQNRDQSHNFEQLQQQGPSNNKFGNIGQQSSSVSHHHNNQNRDQSHNFGQGHQRPSGNKFDNFDQQPSSGSHQQDDQNSDKLLNSHRVQQGPPQKKFDIPGQQPFTGIQQDEQNRDRPINSEWIKPGPSKNKIDKFSQPLSSKPSQQNKQQKHGQQSNSGLQGTSQDTFANPAWQQFNGNRQQEQKPRLPIRSHTASPSLNSGFQQSTGLHQNRPSNQHSNKRPSEGHVSNSCQSHYIFSKNRELLCFGKLYYMKNCIPKPKWNLFTLFFDQNGVQHVCAVINK